MTIPAPEMTDSEPVIFIDEKGVVQVTDNGKLLKARFAERPEPLVGRKVIALYTRAHPIGDTLADGLVERLELEGDARTLRGHIKEFGETPSMTASRAAIAEARLAALTTALEAISNDAWRTKDGEMVPTSLAQIARAALEQAKP